MRIVLAMWLVCSSAALSASPLSAQESQTSAASDGNAQALQAQRRADWAQVRAARMQPLSVPQGENAQAWRRYTVELAGRLSKDGDSVAYWQLTMLDDSASTDADEIRDKIHAMADSSDLCLLAAPNSRRLAKVIADALQKAPPASMQGDTLVFVGAPADAALMQGAASRAGVTLQVVDASASYPGKVEPEAVPDWFDGPRY